MAKTPRLKKSVSPAAHDAQSEEFTAPRAREVVARRAYDLYLARGCEPGHDIDDWLQAEREVRSALQAAPSPQSL